MGLISQKLRDSASGQPCTFQTSFCNGNRETTILCHLPSEIKGMGNKSDDFVAAFGCSDCHNAIDQHKLEPEVEQFYCYRALVRTLAIWVRSGLVSVAGIDPNKPKTRPGKKAKMPSRPLPKVETKWPSRKLESRNTLAVRQSGDQP